MEAGQAIPIPITDPSKTRLKRIKAMMMLLDAVILQSKPAKECVVDSLDTAKIGEYADV